jgi:RimJ/RimL family protein N-acetyltransferase
VNRMQTERLELVQLDLTALDAWIARDAHKLHALIGARFAEPVDAPPLFGEDLPRIRALVAQQRSDGPWLFVLRETREPVGCGGVGAFSQGTIILGYSIWPRHQRHGYATEAAAALCEHAFTLPAVERIRALVPIGHVASERVIARAGLVRIGEDVDVEAGKVGIYERSR